MNEVSPCASISKLAPVSLLRVTGYTKKRSLTLFRSLINWWGETEKVSTYKAPVCILHLKFGVSWCEKIEKILLKYMLLGSCGWNVNRAGKGRYLAYNITCFSPRAQFSFDSCRYNIFMLVDFSSPLLKVTSLLNHFYTCKGIFPFYTISFCVWTILSTHMIYKMALAALLQLNQIAVTSSLYVSPWQC